MNAQNFTQKSIEAISGASKIAKDNQNQQITTLHLLSALLQDQSGFAVKLIEKSGGDYNGLNLLVNNEVAKLPKVSGTANEYASSDLTAALDQAEKQASEMKDEFVSVEHLLYGIIERARKPLKIA